MSLFGTSPDESGQLPSAKQQPNKSLFEDKTRSAPNASSSLFADDSGNDSPWSIPTPKKAGRSELIKNLVSPSNAPDSYVDAFDTMLESAESTNGRVSSDAVAKLLQSSGISSNDQSSLTSIIFSGGNASVGLERSTFHVLMALIGLAQEGDEATLDGVDERKNALPEPSLPYIASLKTTKVSQSTSETNGHTSQNGSITSSPSKPRQINRDSLNDSEVDPWASPAAGRGQTQPVQNNSTPDHGITTARPIISSSATRTTSAFTTNASDPDGSSKMSTSSIGDNVAGGASGAWGGLGNAGFSSTNQDGLAGTGFGSGGDDQPNPRANRAFGPNRNATRPIEETVTITLLPEKEGMFMFQHRNYEVKSARRGSSVVRRYSDFVWLLDCLHKRYPFRQLPLLPPKRVAVNGRHLSSDVLFIEKRRRGLVRFTNALVRHPVLCQEQLVVMFLTVPTELSVWRKQATISVQEEFTGKALPPGLEDSLLSNLQDTFDTVRSGVRRSAETYIGLCNLLERLTKRNQGIAADSLRFSQSLRSLTEDSEPTYATDTNDVPLLNEGIKATAKHLEASHSLLEDEARAWDEGVLEDLKRQRDCLVSVRDMFDRRDRYAKDNIPQLERRIEGNETKLAGIRAKPEGSVKPGELEKVEQAILSDKQSIVNQHARGVFIKECLRDELAFFQQSQYHISKLHQDWSQDLVKYSELQADNWRALSEEVENMPVGES
ncbi:Sorting nexin mvp1 [Thelotrema lepadinum]|nr:Sorting nexin mvp1 [Thelotrema lepadinum]